MPVNIQQQRTEIGSFNGFSLHSIVKLHLNLFNLLFNMFLVSFCIIAITVCFITKFQIFLYLTTLFLCDFLAFFSTFISYGNFIHFSKFIFIKRSLTNYLYLLQYRDIETNPGPQKEKDFSSCHWNVKSLIDLCKLSQLEAYNPVYKHDFICISQTFFDSSVPRRGQKHPTGWLQFAQGRSSKELKTSGVSILFKETLCVHIVKSLNFNQCIICEGFIQSSNGYVRVVYRPPSQEILRKF